MVIRNIRLLYIFNFLVDFRFYAAILILYFTNVTGSFALGMSIFSITMISSAIAELPTGILSDMVGRKRTVVLGSLMTVGALTLYAIGGSYWMLAVGALCEGIGRAFFSGNNEALLYETLKQENKEHEYAHYSGKASSMFQIALAIASLLGGLIATWSFALVMWLSVIPQIIGLVVSSFLIEPKVGHTKETNIYAHLKEALRQFKINRKLRLLSITGIIGYSLGEAGFLFRPAFVNTLWPVWAIGLSATGSYILGSVGFYFSGKILKKISALNALIWENIFSKTINGIALIFPTIVSPALMTLTSFTYGPASIARDTLLQKEFTNQQRATLGSLNSLFGSILFGVAAVGIGFIADTYGPRIALIVVTVILLLPLYFYSEIFKHDKNVSVSAEQ